MASLLTILQVGASSLNAQQAAIGTASQNMSNVNTPGYARQTANLAAGPEGARFDPTGVQIASVTQSRDRFLEAQVPVALGQAAYSQAQSDALSSVTALDPAAAQGVSSALGSFYSSLRALSQNAGDPGLRAAAVSAAASLAISFNRSSQELSAARSGLDAQVQGTLGEVNQAAKTVADLNAKISSARALGAEPNELLDARQKAQDKLAELTGAVAIPDAQGNVSMALPGGQPLVSGSLAATMVAQPSAANGGHLAVQLQRFDGTGPEALSNAELGGAIGGQLQARDGALAAAQGSLDQLASDVGSAINTVSSAGYALDHTSGHDLFTFGAVQGAASRISVDASVAADPGLLAASGSAAAGPGDATNLIALVGTEQQALTTGASAGGTFSNIISSFGAAASQAQAMAAHDGAVKDHITTLRESASGVSIDEEMIKMQQAQRGYEAISKVMTVTSSLLDTLMQMQ